MHCQWASWEQNGECPQPCGAGWQNFSREKIVVERYGGKCNNLYTKKLKELITRLNKSSTVSHLASLVPAANVNKEP